MALQFPKKRHSANDDKTFCWDCIAVAQTSQFRTFIAFSLLHHLYNALAPDFSPKIAHHWASAAIVPISCHGLPSSLFKPLIFAESAASMQLYLQTSSNARMNQSSDCLKVKPFEVISFCTWWKAWWCHWWWWCQMQITLPAASSIIERWGVVVVQPRVRSTPRGPNLCTTNCAMPQNVQCTMCNITKLLHT